MNRSGRRFRILFIIDIAGWAHDFKTSNIIKYLSDEFEIKKVLQNDLTKEDVDQADIVCVYYWRQLIYQVGVLPWLVGKVVLSGICCHSEMEGSQRDGGIGLLKSVCSGVFVHNTLLYNDFKECFDRPVYLCQNGVDTTFFCPDDTPKSAGQAITVGWAGSLTNHGDKRGYHDFIVPAVQAVPGVTLMTAAREDRWRTHAEMRDFYRSLDAYIIASRVEGTPNPGLEAAACGVPVISTRVGNMPELIVDGENGFLVDRTIDAFTDKLTILRDDPGLRNRMGTRIRKDILPWDWKDRAELYRRMFRDITTRLF